MPRPGCSKDGASDLCMDLVYSLMEVFTDICPIYLRQLCKGKEKTSQTMEGLVDFLIQGEYPKRNQEPKDTEEAPLKAEEKLNMLKDMFPDADPFYLETKFEEFKDNQEQLEVIYLYIL